MHAALMRLAVLALVCLLAERAYPDDSDIIVLQSQYAPEIFDHCVERHASLSRASRCMRSETSKRRQLEVELRRVIRDADYRQQLYQACVDAHYLGSMKRISRCVYALVQESRRISQAIAFVKTEIASESAQLELLSICLDDFDASPASLQKFRGSWIIHCVKTKASYYRLHGRF